MKEQANSSQSRGHAVFFACIAIVCILAIGAGAITWATATLSADPQTASVLTTANPGEGPAPSPEDVPALPGSPPDSAGGDELAVTRDEIGAYETGVVLVQVSKGTTREQLQTILANLPFIDTGSIRESDLAIGFAELRITDGTSVKDAIAALESIPGIEGAQPNFVYTLQSDASTFDTYPINDAVAIGKSGDSGYWQLESTNVFDAWKTLGYDKTREENPIGIAVIDTGVNTNHYDLKDRVIAKYNSQNASDTTGGTTPSGIDEVEDDKGHGTHVAGIACATVNNETCIAGASHNSNLVVIKANTSNTKDFTTISLVYAYNWLLTDEEGNSEPTPGSSSVTTRAEQYNVRVVNISIGGGADVSTWNDEGLFEKITAAKNAGIITVCAAGNSDTGTPPYKVVPGDYADTLSVMNLNHSTPSASSGNTANDASGKYHVDLSTSSNYNEPGVTESDSAYTKDICAPGTSIWSTAKYNAASANDETTGYGNNLSRSDTGTSMATPLVSGIAALVYAAAENAGSSPSVDDVISLLEQSAHDLGEAGWDERYGYGEVDAAAAVSGVLGPHISGSRIVGVGEPAGTERYAVVGGDAGDTWTWASENKNVATIDASGQLTPLAAGTATITARCAEKSASMQVTVIDPAISSENANNLERAPNNESTAYTVSGAHTDSLIWQWSLEDATTGSGVAEQSFIGEFSGVLTPNAESETLPARLTITATCATNPNITVSHTVSIVELASVSVTLPGLATREDATYYATYTGARILPSPLVEVNGTLVNAGTNYSVTYGENLNAGEQAGAVTVTAKTFYAEDVTLSFDIEKRNISEAKMSVTPQTYTGSRLTPSPTVTFNGTTLKEGTDYVIAAYSDNTNVGTGRVTIEGMGNFKGVKSADFAINKPSSSSSSSSSASSSSSSKSASSSAKPSFSNSSTRSSSSSARSSSSSTRSSSSSTRASTSSSAASSRSTPATEPQPAEPAEPTQAPARNMHRLYNPNSGEHFYTANTAERDDLTSIGWVYEGTGWSAPESSNTPVYRLYNPNAGDHHYTMSASERDDLTNAGWNYEGIGWYSDDERRVPLYRQYNPNALAGSHNYTTSAEENDILVNIGWRAEGIGWYGM